MTKSHSNRESVQSLTCQTASHCASAGSEYEWSPRPPGKYQSLWLARWCGLSQSQIPCGAPGAGAAARVAPEPRTKARPARNRCTRTLSRTRHSVSQSVKEGNSCHSRRDWAHSSPEQKAKGQKQLIKLHQNNRYRISCSTHHSLIHPVTWGGVFHHFSLLPTPLLL